MVSKKMSYTLRDVRNIVDRETFELMSIVINPQHLPDWFYTPNPALGNEAPVKLYLEEIDERLRDLLIEHGISELAKIYQLKLHLPYSQ